MGKDAESGEGGKNILSTPGPHGPGGVNLDIDGNEVENDGESSDGPIWQSAIQDQ